MFVSQISQLPSTQETAQVELEAVLHQLTISQHVHLDGRAGTGKTQILTLYAQHLARHKRPCILIVFSAEQQKRLVKQLSAFPNLIICTHSKFVIQHQSKLFQNTPHLLVDDAEECLPEVLQAIIQHPRLQAIQLVVAGDERMQVHDHMKSECVWKHLQNIITIKTVVVTHQRRLTVAMTEFIREIDLCPPTNKAYAANSQSGSEFFFAPSGCPRIQYVKLSPFEYESKFFTSLNEIVWSHYSDDQITIMIPTQHDQTIFTIVEQVCYQKHRRPKICTFRQMKSLETTVGIILGFDASYQRMYTGQGNALLLALTRATTQLILIADPNEAPCPYAENGTLSVSRLINPIPPKAYRQLLEQCGVKVRAMTQLHAPVVLPHERNADMNSIYGLTVPAWFAWQSAGICVFHPEQLEQKHEESAQAKQIQINCPQDLFVMSAKELKMNEQLTSLLSACDAAFIQSAANQMHITVNGIETLTKTKDTQFEMEAERALHVNGFVLRGRADLVQKFTLWEFKCKTDISPRDILQTAIYGALCPRATILLYTVLNGIVVELFVENPDHLLSQICSWASCLSSEHYVSSSSFVSSSSSSSDFSGSVSGGCGNSTSSTRLSFDSFSK